MNLPRYRRRADDSFVGQSLMLLALIGAMLYCFAAASWLESHPSTPTTAVCDTDTSCAAWEAAHDVPQADRCHGGPCSAGGAR